MLGQTLVILKMDEERKIRSSLRDPDGGARQIDGATIYFQFTAHA